MSTLSLTVAYKIESMTQSESMRKKMIDNAIFSQKLERVW